VFGTLKVQSFMLTEVRDCDLLHRCVGIYMCAFFAVSVACTLQVFWALVHEQVCTLHRCVFTPTYTSANTLAAGCAHMCICIHLKITWVSICCLTKHYRLYRPYTTYICSITLCVHVMLFKAYPTYICFLSDKYMFLSDIFFEQHILFNNILY